jgi:hypothetical protein
MRNQFENNSTLDFMREVEESKKQNFFNDITTEIKNGYGPCHSCGCQGYVPNYPTNDYCKNCKHHWERHW